MAIITVNPGENINTKAATALPGDIIEIAPGTYTVQQVYISPKSGCVSGTAQNPIIIRAQNSSNKPIISSTNKHPSTLGNTQFIIEDVSHWRVQNIKIENFKDPGFLIFSEEVTVTDVIAEGLELRNQSFDYNNMSSHTGVGVHSMGVFTRPASLTARVENCTIRNCYLYNMNSGDAEHYNEIFTIGGRTFNILIEGNTIENSGIGIAFNNLGWGTWTVCTTNPNCYWKIAQPTGTIFRRNKVINLKTSNYANCAFYNDRALSGTWEENYVIGARTLVAINYELGYVNDAPAPTGPFIVRNNVGILGLTSGSYGSGGVVGLISGSNTSYLPRITNIEMHNNVIIVRNPNLYARMTKFNRAIVVNFHNNIFFEESSTPSGTDFITYGTVDDYGNPYASGEQPNDAQWSISCNGYYSNVVDINYARGFSWPSTGTKIGLIAWKTTGKDANSIKISPNFVNINSTNVEDFMITNDPGLPCGRLGINIGEVVGTVSANFSTSINNLTVSFIDTSGSTNPITSWNWNFGDGNTSTEQNPTHVYETDGIYTVTLTVSNDDATDTETKNIELEIIILTTDPCDNNMLTNGDFSTNDFTGWSIYSDTIGGTTNPCLNNLLTNGDFSTNNFSGWAWIADGLSSASAATGSAVVNVSSPGVSTQLMQNGLSVTSGQQYTIRFSANTTSGNNSMYVVLIQDANPYADLGSGYALINLTSTVQTFNVTFTANANEANARLQFYFASSNTGTIVIDNVCFGTTSSLEGDTFEIVDGHAEVTLTGNASNAQLYQNNLQFVQGQLYGVSFDYRGTVGETAYTQIHLDDSPWTNLGFNESLDLTAETQTFNGTFVSTISTLDGRFRFGLEGITGTFIVDNICVGPVIEPDIVAGFTFNPISAEEDTLVTFTDTSTALNIIDTWHWDFGDSENSSLQNPTHIYNNPGTYNISLTVSNADGEDTYTTSILITESLIVIPLPNVSNKYSLNNIGTVTLINMQPSWFDLFVGDTNLGGIAFVNFNIFSGLGIAIEPITNNILYFDIDTGSYCLESITGTLLDNGVDSRLSKYGLSFPISLESGLLSRGEQYWDWYQAENGLSNEFPSLLINQINKKGTL